MNQMQNVKCEMCNIHCDSQSMNIIWLEIHCNASVLNNPKSLNLPSQMKCTVFLNLVLGND